MPLGLSQDKWFLEPSYQGSPSLQTAPKPFHYLQVPPATSPEHPEFPNSQLFLTTAQYESHLIRLIHIAPLEKQAR